MILENPAIYPILPAPVSHHSIFIAEKSNHPLLCCIVDGFFPNLSISFHLRLFLTTYELKSARKEAFEKACKGL
jgi:hypothetical protein